MHRFAAPLAHQTADMPGTFFVFIAGILTLVIILIVTSIKSLKVGSAAETVVGLLAIVATVTAIVTAIMTATISLDAQRDLDAAQVKSVTSYLHTGFGIDVSDDLALRLSDGESFIVDYRGAPTTIQLIETEDGHLGAVDTARNPLTPRS